MGKISRRSFLKGAGAAAAVIVAPACERSPQQITSQRAPYSFFTPDETAFTAIR